MSRVLSDVARHEKLTPDFDAVREAAARIAPFVRRTPVLHDELLDAELGAEVFFKCENLQRGGAFKLRGATNAVQSLPAAVAGVATHSSGNHGTALALAAEVVLCEPGVIAREKALAEVLRERRLEVVHPYDDERVIAGQGTATLEFLAQQPGLGLLMVPVSGGGLLSGTAIAGKGTDAALRVIGTEPAAADDACRSFRSGERVLLDAPQTIADGLRASLGVRNFAIIRQLVDDMASVSEEGIVAAVKLVLERLKVLIEPSAAVPVAALLEKKIDLRGERVGIILSGGNLDLDGAHWLTGVP
jgi:threonine dehydratase